MKQSPVYWTLAAWLWLDLPTILWWSGALSLRQIWRSPAAVVSSRLPIDHSAAALWYLMGVGTLVLTWQPLSSWLERCALPLRLTVCGAMAVMAAVSFPFVSHDLFVYFAEWRSMSLHHLNPMISPIARIPHWRDDGWLLLGGWQKSLNPYGPAWFLLVSLMGHIGPNFLGFYAVWKGTALIFTAVAALAINQIRPGAGIRMATHPLVGVEFLANAHNDCVMVGLVAVAYWLWTQRRWALSGMAAGLSASTKYISVVVLVWLLAMVPTATRRAGALGMGLLVGAVAIAPFWHGFQTLLGPLGTAHLFLRSPAFVVQGTLVHLAHMTRSQARHWGLAVSTALFLAIYLATGARFLRDSDPLHVGDALLAAALVLMSWLQFWYVTWALPFYALSSKPRAIRMMAYLASLEAVRSIGWPVGLPAAVQIVQTGLVWAGLVWAAWPSWVLWRQALSARQLRLP